LWKEGLAVFEFDEEQRLTQKNIHDFARKELAPRAAYWDASEEFPWESVKKMAGVGLTGLRLPMDYGGAEADLVTCGIALEEVARFDHSCAIILCGCNITGRVLLHASKIIRDTFLPDIVKGKSILAFGATESEAGSDIRAIKTVAKVHGNSYVVSGEKLMITFAEMLKNNTRNFYALVGGCKEGLSYEMDMASIAAGSIEAVKGRPFFVAGLCVTSPLTHTNDFVEELFACGENNIPVYIEADALAGGTAPFTISGTAVEINANVLGAVALAQMANPGAPCIYASSSGILDMRSLNLGGSAPESTLLHMAQAQLAHHYGLPYYGSNTPDSKLPDTQMGYESALHFLGCAMGGVNIVHVAIGNLEMMSLANYEKCLIDNEILGATFRMLRGIDCSRDAIGIDAFRAVKHSGQFLETDHTLKYLRRDRWETEITDRNSWDRWLSQTGGKDMRERAREKAKKILETHNPVYIGDKEAMEIDKIASIAQQEIVEIRRKYKG